MGSIDSVLSWTNRVVILLSVALLTLTFLSKHANVPLPPTALKLTHLISFSSWFGTSVWVSFIAGIVLIRAVDMDTFGRAQAKLFDAYFKFSFLCVAAAGFSGAGLVAHGKSEGYTGEEKALGIVPFGVALVCVLANLFYVSPRTTTVMFERQRLCKDLGVDRKDPNPEVRELNKKFGMYHGTCNLLNLVALGAGFVHACTLAARLSL